MSRLASEMTMDQIDDWFKIGKTVKMASVPRSKIAGHSLDPQTGQASKTRAPEPFVPPYMRHARIGNPNQTAYADHYKQQEADYLSQQLSDINIDGMSTADSVQAEFEQLEAASSIAASTVVLPNDMTPQQAVEVYNNYNFAHKYDRNLAIAPYRQQIIDTIESNQVTVIEGSTGSGKTTQVPQYILDSYVQQKRYCNILVTQPRRIAAMSIARRVCHERDWQLTGICGYQVGMDRQASDDTRLIYCTTGVLLQKLISEKNMQKYTHIILDEIHERDQDSDFCLLVVRKLLRSNSKDVKVVLMSATIDSQLFAKYFQLPVLQRLEPAPVICIEGRSYTVSEYYVEHLEALGTLPILDANEPKIPPESYDLAVCLIKQLDNLEQPDEHDATGLSESRGSVLVFLPGLEEIHQMDERLRELIEIFKLWIRPLHSSITKEEQVTVFNAPAAGYRKIQIKFGGLDQSYALDSIILSTNIAESSITVPDVRYVIDFCLTKNLMCDPVTNYTSLQVEWAAQTNCTQRKGRSGRVSNGRVYRMVSHNFYLENIQKYSIPEMQRCPLDQLVLKVKVLGLGEPKMMLGLALSPPNLDDIERTILMLRQVGALAALRSGAVNPHDGQLTFLGRVLAGLPVDIRIGKLMLLGHVFGLLEETIIIAASLSLKSFFAQPFKAHLEAYRHKLGWARHSFSDCLAYLNAYNTWAMKKELEVFHQRNEAEWAKQKFIQLRRIREVKELVEDLKKRLAQFNIRIPPGPKETRADFVHTSEGQLLLKLVLCGAFYPNYFVNAPIDDDDALRVLSGWNPYTTVMVKGLPSNQGLVYKQNLENMFLRCDGVNRPRIHCEQSRAYIEFPRDSSSKTDISGVISAVFLAVKMRQLRIPLELDLFDPSMVEEKLRALSDLQEARSNGRVLRTNRISTSGDVTEKKNGPQEAKQVPLPSAEQTAIPVYITEITDCGHFWAHYSDEDTWRKLSQQHRTINMYRGHNLQPMVLRAVTVGELCLAPFQDETREWYRARIEKVFKGNNTNPTSVQVFFLDYGNVSEVMMADLRQMDPSFRELDFQAFKCELCGIKPSAIKCPNGRWTEEAKQCFARIVGGSRLFAKVYSVVEGVLRVDLYEEQVQEKDVHINQRLIDHCYADKTEETLTSKRAHHQRIEDARCFLLNGFNPKSSGGGWLEHSLPQKDIAQLEHGIKGKRCSRITLNGPYSPYEMQFYSMTSSGRLRPARIERDSINSVAIDAEPQTVYNRLMVAAQVGISANAGVMQARDTTLLPSIPGMPALVTLLFTPNAEFRTDPQRQQYTGALCGLGWDIHTGGPALPDHDIELTFDAQFGMEDISMINSVRIAMNMAIGSESNVAEWGPDAMLRIQRTARQKLCSLFKMRREVIEPKNFPRPYCWNQVEEDQLLLPSIEQMAPGTVLFNLHCGIVLCPSTDDQQVVSEETMRKRHEEKQRHIQELHSKASRSTEQEDILCQLCNHTLQTPRELMLHLATRAHCEQEAALL